MITKLKDNRFVILRVVACFLLALASVGLFAFNAHADDDSKDKDFTFYRVASAVSSYYDMTHNDSEDAASHKFVDNGWVNDPNNLGRAGAFVGFIDQDYDSGIFGATVSYLSSSSQNRGYNTYVDKALKAYIQYGHALSSMGFDSNASVFLDFATIIRAISGAILAIFYTTAMSVEYVFDGVLGILQALNPFAWFLDPRYTANSPFIHWLDGAKHDNEGVQTAMSGITEAVSQWYKLLQDLGILMLPIFLACLAAGILLFRSTASNPGNGMGARIRKYAVRTVFIFAGVPILGLMYTSTLNSLLSGNESGMRGPAANQILSSTLVDFESWSLNKRLALPEGVNIVITGVNSTGGDIDLLKTTALRCAAVRINHMSNPKFAPDPDFQGVCSPKTNSATDDSKSAVMNLNNNVSGTTTDFVSAAYSVIGRYTSGAFYDAANFETSYKTYMQHKDSFKKGKHKTHSVTVNNFGSGVGYYGGSFTTTYNVDDDSTSATGKLMDFISHDGKEENYESASCFDKGGGCGPYFTDNTPGALSASVSGGDIVYSGSGKGTGLSTMSMYNYMTSKFGGSTVTTYSSHKVSSGFMRESHRSVNLIGNGFSTILYYFYAIIVLLCLTIIGWGYAFAIFFNMIKRGVTMVMGLPFALLGNLRAMAKVVTIVAMMIIELVGTMFVYKLMVAFLLNLNGIFETPLNRMLSAKAGSTIMPILGVVIPGGVPAGIGSWGIALITLMLSSIAYIMFTIWAIRYRKSFVKTMDELVAGFIDRLFSPTTMTNGESGAGSAYANKKTAGEKIANAAKQTAGMAGGMMAANAIDKAVNGKKSGASALSKGDAALAEGLDGDIGEEGGIEGGENQNLSDGPDKPEGSGGAEGAEGDKSLESGGGTKSEKEGQKLIGSASLSENAGAKGAEGKSGVSDSDGASGGAENAEGSKGAYGAQQGASSGGSSTAAAGVAAGVAGAAGAKGVSAANGSAGGSKNNGASGSKSAAVEGAKNAEGKKLMGSKSLGENNGAGGSKNNGASGSKNSKYAISDNIKTDAGNDVEVNALTGVDNDGGFAQYMSHEGPVNGNNIDQRGFTREQYNAGVKQNRKQGISDMKAGAKSMVAGNMKRAIGNMTGNRELAAQGAAQAKQGASKVSAGRSGFTNAETNTTKAMLNRGLARTNSEGVARATSKASAINGGGRVQQTAETMSGLQLQSAVSATGSRQVASMGSHERAGVVTQAQNMIHDGHSERFVQRAMGISEGKTSSKVLSSQARDIRSSADRMRNALKANPNASSYNIGGNTYTRDELRSNITRRENEASVREQAVKFRETRQAGRKKDGGFVKKVLNNKTSAGGDYI